MSLTTQLFDALPDYFDKDPDAIAALAITSTPGDEPVTLRIASRLLTVIAPAYRGTFDLRAHTLNSLSLAVAAALPGLFLSVLDEPTVPAVTLMDTSHTYPSAVPMLRFRSVLWALVSPLAWALDDTVATIDAGHRQMTLKTATGLWVDHWGATFYGGVLRSLNEVDRVYADRVIREAVRWRINDRAIEAILLEDLGLDALIRTLHDQAWVISRTPFGKLTGRKYSRTTFEVETAVPMPDAGRWLVERNRAAGTLVFYLFRAIVGIGSAEGLLWEVPTQITATAPIGVTHLWWVGRTPLGRQTLVRPGNLGVVSLYAHTVPTEPVIGAEGGGLPAFSLGSATLGGGYGLGAGTLAGMVVLTESSGQEAP
jgi:hypothetical protein